LIGFRSNGLGPKTSQTTIDSKKFNARAFGDDSPVDAKILKMAEELSQRANT
jgi:hypothetical protein